MLWWTLVACGDPADALRQHLVDQGVTVRDLAAKGDGTWSWTGEQGDRFCTGTVTPGPGVGPVRLAPTDGAVLCDPMGGAVERAWTCDHRDDGIACREAGVMLQEAKDPAAVPLLQRACALGEGVGCRLMGLASRHGGLGVGADPAAAADWFERGCNLSDDRSCLQRGRGLATDDNPAACGTDAKKWYVRGGPESTNALAELLDGCPEGDPARARDAWRESCDGGSEAGCRNLARALAEGRGGPVDLPGAVKLLSDACHVEPPDARACVDLGERLLETGEAGAGPRALGAFQKACDAGHGAGCRRAGETLREGPLGVSADGREARVAFQKACDAGDEPSCRAPGVEPAR